MNLTRPAACQSDDAQAKMRFLNDSSFRGSLAALRERFRKRVVNRALNDEEKKHMAEILQKTLVMADTLKALSNHAAERQS